MSLQDFLNFQNKLLSAHSVREHIATGLTVLVGTCDERVSEPFSIRVINSEWLHLSLSCENSGEPAFTNLIFHPPPIQQRK